MEVHLNLTKCRLFILMSTLAICKGFPAIAPTEEKNNVAENSCGLCLVDDEESPIYVSPPVPEEPKSQSFIIRDANWTIKKSSGSYQGPVTDKRWEDFGVEYTNDFRFLIKTSMAFSIFADKDLEVRILLTGKQVFDQISVPIIGNEQWVDFGFLKRDGNVSISVDGKVIKTTFDLEDINEIFVKMNETGYWKKHEYDYSYSEVAGPYNFVLPTELGSCLMLYVSMCSRCFLKVQDNTIGPKNSTEIGVDSWQHLKIEMNSKEVKEITLDKGKYDDSVPPYWSTDIRACSNITHGKTILNITLPATEINETRECRCKTRCKHNVDKQLNNVQAFSDDKNRTLETNCSNECLRKCKNGEDGKIDEQGPQMLRTESTIHLCVFGCIVLMVVLARIGWTIIWSRLASCTSDDATELENLNQKQQCCPLEQNEECSLVNELDTQSSQDMRRS